MQIRILKAHKGIGDSIEAAIKVAKIDKVVSAITNAVGIEDCGCNKRKENLNNPDLLINKIFYGQE
jgi:hypothetical protein